MPVKAIMTPEVDPEASVQAVAQKMPDDDVGAVPVAENDRLVGMVTDRRSGRRRRRRDGTPADVSQDFILIC
ncbi:MAG: CBS domain-containing protein [Gammaproteobacteria bacterium]